MARKFKVVLYRRNGRYVKEWLTRSRYQAKMCRNYFEKKYPAPAYYIEIKEESRELHMPSIEERPIKVKAGEACTMAAIMSGSEREEVEGVIAIVIVKCDDCHRPHKVRLTRTIPDDEDTINILSWVIAALVGDNPLGWNENF
jgi:hypothetical protein